MCEIYLDARRLGGRTTPLNEHVAYGFHVVSAKYWSSPIGDRLPPANFSAVREIELGVRHSSVCEVKLDARRSGGRTTPLNEHVAYGFHVLRAKYWSSPIGDRLPPANH